MNILLVEDRGASAFFVERWCEEHGHVVLAAYSLRDAQAHWDRRKDVPIHCIILDLQMSMDVFSKTQKLRAAGGTLAGWVWFYDNVLLQAPDMRQRTIIYSDFVSVLRNMIPKNECIGVRMIPKRARSSSASEMVACIQEIAKTPS